MRDEDTERNKIDPQNIVLLYDNEELLNRNPFRFRLKEVAIGPGECLLFSPTKLRRSEPTSHPRQRLEPSQRTDLCASLPTTKQPADRYR